MPIYMSPEILLSNQNNEGYSPFPVDIWAAGIALYIMLSGTLPFNFDKDSNNDSLNNNNISNDKYNSSNSSIEYLNDRNNLQYNIINNNYKPIEDISSEAKNLLKGILNKDPKKRLTVDEILNHPWLKEDSNYNNNKYHLFTKAEMIMLNKTYIDYRYGNTEDLKENFTNSNLEEKNEDNNNNNINNENKKVTEIIEKNIETKSDILAPYNSLSNQENSEEIEVSYDEIEDLFNDLNNVELTLKNNIIKFSHKVKEFNINYEINNNDECDNGIVINTHSKTESYVINNTLNKSYNENNNNDNNINKNINKEENEKNKIENILNKIEELGYNKNYVQESLKNNLLNHATVVYYLMMNYENI